MPRAAGRPRRRRRRRLPSGRRLRGRGGRLPASRRLGGPRRWRGLPSVRRPGWPRRSGTAPPRRPLGASLPHRRSSEDLGRARRKAISRRVHEAGLRFRAPAMRTRIGIPKRARRNRGPDLGLHRDRGLGIGDAGWRRYRGLRPRESAGGYFDGRDRAPAPDTLERRDVGNRARIGSLQLVVELPHPSRHLDVIVTSQARLDTH